ncbi:MAG: putative transporter permease protein [Dehalococcoidia bacterium]|nr:putative transporter permease protein [Dehalococcoidia bacterium]
MKLKANLLIALQSIQANKLRSSLTMLGIIIGVGAVIALMSIGRGTQATITARVANLGTNLLFVRPGSTQAGNVSQGQGTARSLTLEDARAITESGSVPHAAAVAPESSTNGQVVVGSRNMRTRIVGVTESYEQVRNYQLEYGEFVSPSHVDTKAAVAVLGANVANTLFPDDNPLEQRIKINRQLFRVIGVLKAKGGTGFGSQDDQIIIPVTTLMSRLSAQRSTSGVQNVALINVQVTSAKDVEAAKTEIATLLRERHRIQREDDFEVSSQEEALQTLNQITGVFTMFLGSIAGISLLVGGIGIMNIMLVSVTERTREIGIRKAVGAKRRDILMQFLVEATVLSLTGGGMGLTLGLVASRLLRKVSMNGNPLNTVVSPDIIVLAVVVSAAIGLFFGVYPATRAAKLNPIEALRYE